MKALRVILIICLILLGAYFIGMMYICYATTGEVVDPPWGVWQSTETEPQFTFTIDPEDETYRFPGTYEVDGETTEIFLRFLGRDESFQIYPMDAINKETGALQGDMYLFGCSYRIKDDVMTCWFYSKGEDTRFELAFVKIAELEEHPAA